MAGLMAHALALVALGADSFIELISALMLLWGLSVEMRGASRERVARAEKASEWVVGIALFLLAVYIVWGAIHSFVTRTGAESSGLGLGLAVVSAVLMPFLAWIKRKMGHQIGSDALIADSSSTIVCAYMAWTVLVGVGLTALFGWWWADSVAALALVYFVIKEGIEAIQEARGAREDTEVS